jgi:hypothetical protein
MSWLPPTATTATTAVIHQPPACQPRITVQIQQCRAVSEIARAEDGRAIPTSVGADGRPVPARVYPAMPLVDALRKSWPAAHDVTRFRDGSVPDQSWYLTGYGILVSDGPGPYTHTDLSPECPRLAKSGPALLTAAGVIPNRDHVVAGIIMLDGDLCDMWPKTDPRYAKWYASPDPSVAEKLPWNAERMDLFCSEILPLLRAEVPWSDRCACWYTTPNGFRLVYALTRPVPVTGLGATAENITRGLMADLAVAGVAVDTGCGDWTRHMRVPRCQKGSRRTDDGEYFRLSWNGIDPDAQDADDPPATLQACPPESFPLGTSFRITEYTSHPNWATIQRVMAGGWRPGHEVEVTDTDVGTQPTEEQAEALLRITGSNRPTNDYQIIQKQLKTIAGGQRKFGHRVATAQRLIKLLYEGAPILADFAKAHGKSGLHNGNYAATWDLCSLLAGEPAATPQMVYALLVGSYITAMEARAKAGGDGVRTTDEVRAEAWRAVASVYPVIRAQVRARDAENDTEQREAQAALERFRAEQAVASTALAQGLAEMTGQSIEWATENLTRHLIVTSKLGVSVLQNINGRVQYSEPATRKGDWLVAIQQAGHDLIEYADDEGKSLPDADIIGRYATVCGEAIKASRLIDAHRVTYAMEAGELRPTFWLRLPGVAEDLQPVHHPEIERFFAMLGGEHLDVLLDWFACFTMIDRPLPALYLHGEPNVGKGLLAAGLAKLTARKMSAEFGDSLGNFQDFYRDTYFIFVDEDTNSSPGSDFSKDIVGVIRRMIGGQMRHLNFKGVKGMEVDGEWRLYIAANNAGVLEIRKDLTATDIAALEGRIFYLNCTRQSKQLRDYLDSQGGNLPEGRGTARWPDWIAEHILWLRQNRRVKYGKRFLIEAPPTPWHESLRVSSNAAMSACRIIVEAVQRHADGQWTLDFLDFDRVGKKTHLMTDNFRKYAQKNDLKMTPSRLTAMINLLSMPGPRRRLRIGRGQHTCAVIDWRPIIRVMHEAGHDLDAVRELLGEAWWREVAPPEVVAAYDATGSDAPAAPPPPPPPPPPATATAPLPPPVPDRRVDHTHPRGDGPNPPASRWRRPSP